MMDQPFWRTKALTDMTREEWESLCDGCARCCLVKLEDAHSGEISPTDVACRLLDLESCRCTNYPARMRLVSDCISLSTDNIDALSWLPPTCGYRLIAEGKDLYWWHPLVSGRFRDRSSGRDLRARPGRLRGQGARFGTGGSRRRLAHGGLARLRANTDKLAIALMMCM